jgi:hypothetical protein
MVAPARVFPDPQTFWESSTMTEAKIQALVDHGLLRPKAEVEWKAPTGEAFATEDDKAQVVFGSFFERRFNIPACNFFRGLPFYYKLELLHLIPNSITIVSMFIHFCEAYLGISPHFLLWRYLFCVKTTDKRAGVVGAVIFCLRSGLKSEWIDTDLPDNNARWRSDWFYIADQRPTPLKQTRNKPVKIPEWDLVVFARGGRRQGGSCIGR